tara:strand:- start:1815 stop:2579 length:765 start_codon:yes stop_codon:yes gene_type:complete
MQTQLTPLAAGFAVLLLVGLPVLAAIEARRSVDDILDATFNRNMLYVSMAFSLIVIAILTLGVAAWQDLPSDDMGWTINDARVGFIWAFSTTIIGLLLIWAITTSARLIGWEESAIPALIVPTNASETRGFLLLSGMAAVCEEYVFRGFGLWAISQLTGSPWLAAVVVSGSFGLAHGYQNLVGIVRTGTLGMILAISTIMTGSLFPAIVAHFWINAAIGLGGWRYLDSDSQKNLSKDYGTNTQSRSDEGTTDEE